jgi:hypothetical protein
MVTAEVVSYLRWKKDVAEHDYAAGDIADGYHRLSLACALDPYATVPLKLGGVTAP